MFWNIRNSCLLLALLSFSSLKASRAADSAAAAPVAGKMNVYFISGLGADERIFTKLKLDPRLNVHYIKWVRPEKRETLRHYAARLSQQIDSSQPFQLVGLSFGGVVASEIADVICPQQVTIISSMSTGVPLSRFYQVVMRGLLLSPLASPFLKSANRLTYRYFGAETPELKKLLRQILHDTDSKFMKWALIRMGGWDRKERVENLFHIHGTADKLIPVVLAKPDLVIEGGGHLMVYAQAEQISKILNERLTTIHSAE